MSVYPAGVDQFFRELVTIVQGKVTLIDRPCVVKGFSASPFSSATTSSSTTHVIVLNVLDGDSIIIKYSPTLGPQLSNTNSPLLIPADGLRISSYLAVQCVLLSGTPAPSDLGYKNIRVDYQ